MSQVKASILPGFIELLPEEQVLFNHLKDTIEETYKKAGFYPLDTPVLEKKEVLLAKGGGETEKQVYELTKGKTDMAMRFDLTVPLARYVAQHYNDLSFPFRRYHIAKVYRGERNQRGRYREFYQCDIDIVGDEHLGLSNDAEVLFMIYQVFTALGLKDITIHVNHRKVLSGFFKALGMEDLTEVLRILDKYDKIGWEAVKDQLRDLGSTEDQEEKIYDFINLSGTNAEKLEALETLVDMNEDLRKGLDELREILDLAQAFGVDGDYLHLDLKIARGLDYYTGVVFETTLNGHEQIGSVCSGGRYDHLAKHYSKKDLPGVGMSIGLSRLFYQLQEENLIRLEKKGPCQALILPMEGFIKEAISLSRDLREAGISAFVYGEQAKMKKMFKYADGIHVPYVLILGEEEVKNGSVSLRNMTTGAQDQVPVDQVADAIN